MLRLMSGVLSSAQAHTADLLFYRLANNIFRIHLYQIKACKLALCHLAKNHNLYNLHKALKYQKIFFFLVGYMWDQNFKTQ